MTSPRRTKSVKSVLGQGRFMPDGPARGAPPGSGIQRLTKIPDGLPKAVLEVDLRLPAQL